MSKSGSLYLIPSLLGERNYTDTIPAGIWPRIAHIRHFIVEDVRTARRFLKYGGFVSDFSDVSFYVLNKHTPLEETLTFLSAALNGLDTGLISEAGCPCVADPGAQITALAHEKNIKVLPLVGPSSVIMALMASGFNGQNFAFLGYLPIEQAARTRKIKELEMRAQSENQTQIFIETPFRNQKLLLELLSSLGKNTRLCIATDITTPNESIFTKNIATWKTKIPDINKKQVVFLVFP